MRIRHLTVSGFRAFSGRTEIPLDADVVLLIGANGRGKTSLLDAILWALLGRLPRLHDKQSEVVCKYGSGTAHVALTFGPDGDEPLVVRRSYDGERMRTLVERGDQRRVDVAAESWLSQVLWPYAGASDPLPTIERVFTRSMYLQQDQLAHFVAADTDAGRFEVMSDLVGATEIAQLEDVLSRERRAWSARTNEMQRDLEASRQTVARLEAQVARLAPAMIEGVDVTNWRAWWEGVSAVISSDRPLPPPDASGAAALDAAMAALAAQEALQRRRLDALTELRTALEAKPPAPSEERLAELRRNAEALSARLSSARDTLLAAQTAAAEERRRQVAAKEAREELATLAALAQRHLGDTCPVCGQAIESTETRQRLEHLVVHAGAHDVIADSGVAAAAERLEELERLEAATASEISRIEREARIWTDWQFRVSRLAKQGGLKYEPLDTLYARTTSRCDECAATLARLASLQSSGERLALALAHATQAALLASSRREYELAQLKTEQIEADYRTRQRAGELASRTIDALRRAASALVSYRLGQLQPLAQAIYSRIDPHPSLRVVELNARYSYGKGRIDTLIRDPEASISSDAPEAVLSSSQLNAYALSIFLSLNLGGPLSIRSVMLDDPLQSMDDVNLLGVADLLRRLRAHRQILVSTHESRLASLLQRKLRPVKSEERTLAVDFREWSPDGPQIEVTNVPADPRPLRIVA